MAVYHSDSLDPPAGYSVDSIGTYAHLMYGGIYKQDDVVGQYLVREATRRAMLADPQAPGSIYSSGCAGYDLQSHQSGVFRDSYTSESTQQGYPNPEHIRHLYTLHSLLPHIQPERRLNALGGLEVDIVEGYSGHVFCRAVSKKMLVLFLGRDVVTKFLHTVQREQNEAWRGPPTQQNLVLPYGVASKAAITILVSWMTRACKYATMHTMKQIRLPNNLFAACSLAQTMEMLGLHKDAYRLDSAISQQFFKRPVYAVELETLWNCLGEDSKYVYGCVKAVSSQCQSTGLSEDMQSLSKRHPCLYARIRDPTFNEMYKPQFGRLWFAKLRDGEDCYVQNKNGDRLQDEPSRDEATCFETASQPRTPEVRVRGGKTLNASAPAFQPNGSRE